MDQRDVKAFHFVEIDNFVADERQIQIARVWAISVKWRAIFPAFARDGAAAKQYTRPRWQICPYHVAEFLKTMRVSAKDALNKPVSHLFLSQFVLFLSFFDHTAYRSPARQLLFRRT